MHNWGLSTSFSTLPFLQSSVLSFWMRMFLALNTTVFRTCLLCLHLCSHKSCCCTSLVLLSKNFTSFHFILPTLPESLQFVEVPTLHKQRKKWRQFLNSLAPQYFNRECMLLFGGTIAFLDNPPSYSSLPNRISTPRHFVKPV